MQKAHLLLGSWEILQIVELNSRKAGHVYHLPQPSVGIRRRHFGSTFHSRFSSFSFIPHSSVIIMTFIDLPSNLFILCSSQVHCSVPSSYLQHSQRHRRDDRLSARSSVSCKLWGSRLRPCSDQTNVNLRGILRVLFIVTSSLFSKSLNIDIRHIYVFWLCVCDNNFSKFSFHFFFRLSLPDPSNWSMLV